MQFRYKEGSDTHSRPHVSGLLSLDDIRRIRPDSLSHKSKDYNMESHLHNKHPVPRNILLKVYICTSDGGMREGE